MRISPFLSIFGILRLVLLLCFIVPAFSVSADTDFDVLAQKAERFYRHKEWASALAMYELMLMQRPGDAATYGNAIVVNGLTGDTNAQVRLIEQTQVNGIAMDDIFKLVKKESFEIGKPKVYEDLLLALKQRQPWMRRSIDIRLLDYYDSRNNAPKMEELCDILLSASPADTGIMHVKARALMLESRCGEAMSVYRQILALDSTDFEALVQVGTYFHHVVKSQKLSADSPEARKALRCLSSAYAIKRNPYIHILISEIPSR